MQRQSIVILGSGGFGREVAALLEDINAVRPTFEIVGFMNTDKEDASGRLVDGYPILNRSYLTSSPCPFTHVALGVGLPAIRRRVALQVKQIAPHLIWPNLVHPSAILSKRVRLNGEGIVITAGNILTTNIEISSFAMLNLSCTVGHDVTIGSYAVLSPE